MGCKACPELPCELPYAAETSLLINPELPGWDGQTETEPSNPLLWPLNLCTWSTLLFFFFLSLTPFYLGKNKLSPSALSNLTQLPATSTCQAVLCPTHPHHQGRTDGHESPLLLWLPHRECSGSRATQTPCASTSPEGSTNHPGW